MRMTSFQLRQKLQNVFIIGLNEIFESYTGGCSNFKDAQNSVESIHNKKEQDLYENIPVFGGLSSKEKIVCLAEVAQMFLESTDMKNEKWYKMWFQATCYTIFQYGLKNALEFENKTTYETTYRTQFCEIYNDWFNTDEEKITLKHKNWGILVKEFWNDLVDNTSEPWADEDFLLPTPYAYTKISTESEFDKSLSYLLTKKQTQKKLPDETLHKILTCCKSDTEVYTILALAIRAKIMTPKEAETEGRKLGITVLNYY